MFLSEQSNVSRWWGHCCPLCATRSVVHSHRCLQGVVGVQVVVCVSSLTSGAAVASEAQNSGSDGAPLCLGEGDGAGVQGANVGEGHGVFPWLTLKSYHGGRGLPTHRTVQQQAHQWRCRSSPTPVGGWRCQRHKPGSWGVSRVDPQIIPHHQRQPWHVTK